MAAPAGRRKLALQRAATQSSAYDYNLAAQLITDGIRESAMPRWFRVTTSEDGVAPGHTQPFLLDDNLLVSSIELDEPGWIGLELGGGAEPFAVDRVEIALQQSNWLSGVYPRVFGLPDLPPGRCLEGYLPAVVLGLDDDAEGAENRVDGNVEWSLAASPDGRR